ncbi:MAG TPA: hypothetical protein VN604_05060 [Nitrospirota bacterium]|nr:hypothetical protein [Nitrospirota bacterium]
MSIGWYYFDLFTIVSGIAIMIMAVAVWKAFEYKTVMPAGKVKRTWRLLIALIIFFFFGYIILPFFVLIPESSKDTIVAFLFFFGAVYVLVTLNLIVRIVISMKKD